MTRTWTEGVCSDGAAILCDGVPVPISELLTHLNRCEFIRSAALEEAARVADDKEDGLVNHSKRFPTNPNIAHEYLVRAADASDIAAAIRVLKDKDTRTPTEGESI